MDFQSDIETIVEAANGGDLQNATIIASRPSQSQVASDQDQDDVEGQGNDDTAEHVEELGTSTEVQVNTPHINIFVIFGWGIF
jgi:hypothetical protein